MTGRVHDEDLGAFIGHFRPEEMKRLIRWAIDRAFLKGVYVKDDVYWLTTKQAEWLARTLFYAGSMWGLRVHP